MVSAVPQPQYVLELGELEQSQHNPDAARQYALFRTEEQLFTANGVTLDTEPTLFEADHGAPPQPCGTPPPAGGSGRFWPDFRRS